MKIPEHVEPTVVGALVALMEMTRSHFLETAPHEDRQELFRLAYDNADTLTDADPRQVAAYQRLRRATPDENYRGLVRLSALIETHRLFELVDAMLNPETAEATVRNLLEP